MKGDYEEMRGGSESEKEGGAGRRWNVQDFVLLGEGEPGEGGDEGREGGGGGELERTRDFGDRWRRKGRTSDRIPLRDTPEH